MKLSTWFAIWVTSAVIGIILAHVLTRQPIGDGTVHLSAGLLIIAALAWNSSVVNGWITKVIDHLPTFGGGKKSG